MSEQVFVDTNVLVYSVADNERKRTVAMRLLEDHDIACSTQVIGEFIAATTKKGILDLDCAIDTAMKFMRVFLVLDMTPSTVSLACDLMKRYRFSYWDSSILASALSLPCEKLYTEDLQGGQLIRNRLQIVNPFELPTSK